MEKYPSLRFFPAENHRISRISFYRYFFCCFVAIQQQRRDRGSSRGSWSRKTDERTWRGEGVWRRGKAVDKRVKKIDGRKKLARSVKRLDDPRGRRRRSDDKRFLRKDEKRFAVIKASYSCMRHDTVKPTAPVAFRMVFLFVLNHART